MTTPTITLYPDTLPAKGQGNAAFDTNVDNFLTWLTLTNGPDLAAMITYTQSVADTVLATALAGNLPDLTGRAGDYIRANAAEDGGEFRTPAQVLADIGATAELALKAPLASPTFTGSPAAPTAGPGASTTQVATTAFVQQALTFKDAYTSTEQTITPAGALTLPHGLGIRPSLIQVQLVCKVANAGYAVGDHVIANNHINTASSLSAGQSIIIDATNINIKFGSVTGVYQLISPVNGTTSTIVSDSWRLVVKAWKLQ